MSWDDELEQLLLAAQDQMDRETTSRSIFDTMTRLQPAKEPANWPAQLYGIARPEISAADYYEALRTELRKRTRTQ